ncbi:hypothetical protein LINGRAHAP2_LOCUS8221 [Linum grandiflorum]
MVESYVRQPIQISSSDELRWKQYARAYALACIGSFLLADRSGAAVHPVYLLLLEQERPSDTEYYAWGLRRWRGYIERWGAQFLTWRGTGRRGAT